MHALGLLTTSTCTFLRILFREPYRRERVLTAATLRGVGEILQLQGALPSQTA